MKRLNIQRTTTRQGVRSVLTYWHSGVRYRPVLGYNLTPEQEQLGACDVITAIHANTASARDIASEPGGIAPSLSLTFAEFIPVYRQYVQAKRPRNDGRNDTILTRHLVPYFGDKRLAAIRLEDGLAYLEKRRTDLIGPKDQKRPVAAGTIERECAVLMAVLNLAVDMD